MQISTHKALQWYVAIVNNRSEKICASKLNQIGVECYVPTQAEIHQWQSGTKRLVERILFPAMLLVHVSEDERKATIVNLPYIKRFMSNRACHANTYGKHPVAVIPDEQIDRLKFILGNANAPVEFEQRSFGLGDKVRVTRGGLMGMEGYIIECHDNGEAYFAIRVDFLGVAKVKVAKEDLEKI